MVVRTIAERYRLEELLGSGGMADVWRATDLQLQETVALKKPREGDARHEARIGTELSHPNVIAVHGTVTEGDQQWLVMEYLPSRTLSDIIEAEGPISPERARRIGAQLADALAAMHSRGMVHRDVKPGNVLVTEDDVAKLSDFGISRWAEQTIVGGGDVAGTPAYLAPEVADGHEARPASDVFALGATLFAAVEGTSPWGSPDAGSAEQLRRAKAYDITPPRHSGPFGDLLAQLMQREPEARPATENVQALLDGVKLPNRRRRRAAVIGAAALVVALAGGYVVYSQLPKAGTVGDPVSMDVCGLAKSDWSQVNARKVDTSAENSYWLSGCTTWMTFADNPSDDEGVVIDYFVDLYIPDGGAKATGTLGPVKQDKSDQESCKHSITMVDGNVLQVETKPGGGPDRPLCDIGKAAAEHARSVLVDGPIPRRSEPWPAASLVNADACTLLSDDDLIAQLKSAAIPFPWKQLGKWGCGWDYTPRDVRIEFNRRERLDDSDGTRVDVGGGRVAYYEPSKDDQNCQVKIEHRVAEDPRLEIVRVYLDESDVADPATLCDGAIQLAKAVVPRLPR